MLKTVFIITLLNLNTMKFEETPSTFADLDQCIEVAKTVHKTSETYRVFCKELKEIIKE